jgi:hypothetical protein
MSSSYEFPKSVLDSITEHIAVINERGEILYVNQSWITFSETNQCAIKGQWCGINYLSACEASADKDEDFVSNVTKERGRNQLVSATSSLA